MTFRRRWFVAASALVAVIAVLFFLLRSYIAHQLTAQVAAFYGGPVEADSAEIGLGYAARRAVPGDRPEGRVWSSADRLDADLTLSDIVLGRRMPSTTMLHQPDVVLRLDQAGKLLTQLLAAPTVTGVLPEFVAVDQGLAPMSADGRGRSNTNADRARLSLIYQPIPGDHRGSGSHISTMCSDE